MKPQNNTSILLKGLRGNCARGDLGTADFEAKGLDRDRTFMVEEIAGDQMYFDTISRTGDIVDSGDRLCHGSYDEFTARFARAGEPLSTGPLKSDAFRSRRS